MVNRVRPTPIRFPTTITHIPVDNTHSHFILSVQRQRGELLSLLSFRHGAKNLIAQQGRLATSP